MNKPDSKQEKVGTVVAGTVAGTVLGAAIEGAGIGVFGGGIPGAALGAVIGAAVGLTGALVYGQVKFARKCTVCGTTLRPHLKGNSEQCAHCGIDLCTAHAHQNPLRGVLPDWSNTETLCLRCVGDAHELIREAQSVEIFSARFRGLIPLDKSKPTAELASGEFLFRDMASAELWLQFACLSEGFDLIFNEQLEKVPARDGNYFYNQWWVTGTAGHRLSI